MAKIVRIIEEVNDGLVTKILWISFDLSCDLTYLFTPRLENIVFIKVDNTITVNLKNPDFRDFFNDWVERFRLKINVNDTNEDIIEKFNNEIKAIILLGKKEAKLSWEKARGLYGEFLVIRKMLLEKTYNQLEILQGQPLVHSLCKISLWFNVACAAFRV
jgi:hypothetical protein